MAASCWFLFLTSSTLCLSSLSLSCWFLLHNRYFITCKAQRQWSENTSMTDQLCAAPWVWGNRMNLFGHIWYFFEFSYTCSKLFCSMQQMNGSTVFLMRMYREQNRVWKNDRFDHTDHTIRCYVLYFIHVFSRSDIFISSFCYLKHLVYISVALLPEKCCL